VERRVAHIYTARPPSRCSTAAAPLHPPTRSPTRLAAPPPRRTRAVPPALFHPPRSSARQPTRLHLKMTSLHAKGMYDRCRTLEDVKEALTEQLERVAILQARGFALYGNIINDAGYLAKVGELRCWESTMQAKALAAAAAAVGSGGERW